MNAPHPDNARAGVTCLGSAVALGFAVVLAAALIRVAGWLPLLLIIVVVVLPICRLMRAFHRFDAIVRESTSDNETGPGAGQ